MKVTIVDYGAGNVPSVERALQRLGAESERTSSPERISEAEALLLPGVGHYAALVRALDEQHMRAPLIAAIRQGVRHSVRVAIKRETPAHGLESGHFNWYFTPARRHRIQRLFLLRPLLRGSRFEWNIGGNFFPRSAIRRRRGKAKYVRRAISSGKER